MTSDELAKIIDQKFSDLYQLRSEFETLKTENIGLQKTVGFLFNNHIELCTLAQMAHSKSLLKAAEKKTKSKLKKMNEGIKEAEEEKTEAGPEHQPMGPVEAANKFLPNMEGGE